MTSGSARSATSVKTTCAYCGVGCGIIATVEAQGVRIQGDPAHPANFGRLCSKGAALGETLDLEGRLLAPRLYGQECDWDSALAAVAEGLQDVIRRHGPEAVAFYVSGQLLTEDYYVANKLMKGFIGSANIDTNSRLCMASSVAGHKRAFGTDTVPGCYEDLEEAELVVLAGANSAWCHPVLFQRLRAAREHRPAQRVVVIDPRRTATAEEADLHLALAPGTDTVLWNGLLHHLRRHGAVDFAFLERHCQGYADALEAARRSAPSIPAVARACGLAEADVATFYNWFLSTEKVVSAYSQGVNQSTCGTDKVNAILNCHLLTGRIGRPGMGPFSLTGQPNAMGGREVGGLANQLAAHLDLEDPTHRELVQTFWQAPTLPRGPGLKAVEMFEAMAAGRIKTVWIMGTNPVVSLPDADRAREALRRCELVVVSDCMAETDTTACAHILLPALAWGEKDGTVTNSERRISRQRAFLPPPGEARPDWWIVSAVARRMGFTAAFDYHNPAQIFREHAALSGFRPEVRRDFDISALAGLDDAAYDALQPLQWPVNERHPGGRARLFGDGAFYTPQGKARLVAIEPRPPAHAPDREYPLVLNTGRVRDQWHTMTRTGKSPRLAAHLPVPYVEIHPVDAISFRLQDGAIARLRSRWGEMLARVRCSEKQRPGSIFVPMHWNDQFARHARVDALVNPATDPLSGEPEFKHTPVRVEPWPAAWYGFVLAAREVDIPQAEYCVRIRASDHFRYEIAGLQPIEDHPAWARSFLCTPDAAAEWTDYLDRAGGRYRGLRIQRGRLDSCVFLSQRPDLPAPDWPGSFFGRDHLPARDRLSLLAGQPPRDAPDAGPIVCACFGVGEKTLVEAIQRQGLRDVAAIGARLKAGTNCGSCIPELKSLIAKNAALDGHSRD